jgi:hypothetical protein
VALRSAVVNLKLVVLKKEGPRLVAYCTACPTKRVQRLNRITLIDTLIHCKFPVKDQVEFERLKAAPLWVAASRNNW